MILTAAILLSVTFFIPFIAIWNKGAIPEFLKTIGGRIENALPKSLSLVAQQAETAAKIESFVDNKPAVVVTPVTTKMVESLNDHDSSIGKLLGKAVYHATAYYKVVSQWLLKVIKDYKLDEYYRVGIFKTHQFIEWCGLPQLWLYIENTQLYQYSNEKFHHLLNEWQILIKKNEPFYNRTHQLITNYIEDKFDSALDVYRYGTKQEKFDLYGELLVYSLILMFVVNLIFHLPTLYKALVQDATEFFRNARTISQQDTSIPEESAVERTAVAEITKIRITKQQQKEEIAEVTITATSSSKHTSSKEETGIEEKEKQKELIMTQLHAFEPIDDVYPTTNFKELLQETKAREQQKNIDYKKNSVHISVKTEPDQQQFNPIEKVDVTISKDERKMEHSFDANNKETKTDMKDELKQEVFQEQYESFNELESLKSAFKGKDLSDQLTEALSNDIRNDLNASSTRSLSVSSSIVQGNLEGSPDSSISPGDEIFMYTPVRGSHHRLSFSSTIGKSFISPSKLIYAPNNTPTSIVNDSHVYSDIIVPNSPQKRIEESIKRSVFSDADSVISDESPESSISIE